MKRYSLSASMLGAVLVSFLFSAIAAQANETKTLVAPISRAAPIGSPSSRSGALDPRPSSAIASTAAFTSYLPLIMSNQGVCSTAPTLLGPANGSHLTTLVPTFFWNSGNDAAGTRTGVQVSKDTGFTQLALDLSSYGGQGAGQFQMYNNLNAATTYYWRAYLMCGSTLQSPYSTVWSFVSGSGGTILPAPALVAPANGSTTSSALVNFQWSPVSGATQYLLYRQAAGSNSTYIYTVANTQTTLGLDAGTTYQWWVSAQNAYATGVASAKWQFTTPSGALLNPLNQMSDTFVMDDGVTTVLER